MKIEIDKVYNIDCINLMREMGKKGIYADLLLTDIPYDVVNRKDNGLRCLDKGNADIETFNLDEFLELAEKCVKGNYVIFCATEQLSKIRKFFADKGYTTRLIIWEKTNPSPMNGQYTYLSGVECAVYAKKKKATFNAFCKNTVFRYPCGRKEYHPTQKPIALFEQFILDLTNENDVVLDTCMGSFTTACACVKLNRHFIGAELDKEYYALGVKRLEQMYPNILSVI